MSAGMPQLDFSTYPSQLFWLVISFSALYFVMARYIVPRIHNVLENRQQRLEYDLDRAASLKAEAEQARETYEAALAEARNQAQTMLTDVSVAIRETSDAKHQELDDILNSKIAESEEAINNARLTANKDLEPTAAEVASALILKLTDQKISQAKMLEKVQSHTLKQAA